MKKILFILLSVTFFPSFACAQQIDSVVSKLLISLEEEKWDDVVDLFDDKINILLNVINNLHQSVLVI